MESLCDVLYIAPMRSRRTHPYNSRRRRFPRFSFDAAWRAGIDALVALWRNHRRGSFIATKTPSGGLVAHINLPDGRVYTTTLRPHHTHGRDWYEGFVTCCTPEDADRDQLLNADGVLPDIAPPSFNLWPCQMKLSPSRFAGDKDSVWFGRLWVSARNDRPGGEVYSIFADGVAEDDVAFRGVVLRYRPG